MTNHQDPRLKELLTRASELPRDRRGAFLDEQCGPDGRLRDEVLSLLGALDRAESFLGNARGATGVSDAPGPSDALASGDPAAFAGGPDLTREAETAETRENPTPANTDPPYGEVVAALLEGPGSRVGRHNRYRLVEPLGEGGFGTVFLAEQEQPVTRQVALKLIKLGMDTRQVVARFEAERQALALMDHPNIARVFDAGSTDSGRPFFAMELVRGVPITRYCDERRLTPPRRLELFVQVCRAVQHAHAKGVIHRDLKPSNVLVAEVDGKPVPKVIDFGIAKATGARLTEKTVFTEHRQMIGTPAYMSPEQADPGAGGEDVDTRCDVYSLGVLLYELLVGTPPFDARELRSKAYAEVQRIIREVDPPAPSTRLGTLGGGLTSSAACRGLEPARLARLVRGELDWVVMRCLEKDRARRYETANALARDVERYLADEPVDAGPPSRAYQARKFARRHRRLLATVAVFALLLVAGAAVSTWQAVRATAARNQARTDRNTARAALGEARTARDAEADARRKADQAKARAEEDRKSAETTTEFLVQAFRSPDPRVVGRDVRVADMLDTAVFGLRMAPALDPLTRVRLFKALGQSYLGLGMRPEAIGLHEEALEQVSKTLGPDHPDTLRTTGELAEIYRLSGRPDEAIPLYEEALGRSRRASAPDDPGTLALTTALASAYLAAGRTVEAATLAGQAVEGYTRASGADDPATLVAADTLASAYEAAGRTGDATASFRHTLDVRTRTLGPADPDTLNSMERLAAAELAAGHPDEAVRLYEQALEPQRQELGPEHPDVRLAEGGVALARRVRDRAREYQRLRDAKGEGDVNTLLALRNLGETYASASAFAEAERLLGQAAARLTEVRAADDPIVLWTDDRLAEVYAHQGRPDLARPLLRGRAPRGRGPDDPDMLVSLTRLGRSLAAAGMAADAEPLLRAVLEAQRRRYAAGDPVTAGPALADALASVGSCLSARRKYADAEPLLREALSLREKVMPDSWTAYMARSMLGESLVGQAKYDEAEPLLVSGYDGIKAREQARPGSTGRQLDDADRRALALYEARGDKARAAMWKHKLLNFGFGLGMASNSPTPPPMFLPTTPRAAPPPSLPFPPDRAAEYQKQAAADAGVAPRRTDAAGLELALIPPGAFRMGREYNVSITRPYYVGVSEVTVGQFRAFVSATGYRTDAERGGKGGLHPRPGGGFEQKPDYVWSAPGFPQTDDHPVVQVSWADAGAFCDWLGRREGARYRLPTEAEWEWACRAGSADDYCFGGDAAQLGGYAWYHDNTAADPGTRPVGRLKPNAWGLYDVHGNAAEWTADWLAPYPTAKAVNPTGPADQGEARFRAVRGGAWEFAGDKGSLGSESRYGGGAPVSTVGFRVVREIAGPDLSLTERNRR